MSRNSMNDVSNNLIKVAGDCYRECANIKPEILHSLYLLHGQTLQLALDLIDNKKVSILESPSGRWVYRVIGGSGAPYTCLPSGSSCQCAAFKYCVLRRKDSLICKHVLAARLASSAGLLQKTQVSDDNLVDILMDMW